VQEIRDLGDHEDVASHGGVHDEREVGCVEKLDWILALLSSVLLILYHHLHSPGLEISRLGKEE
jgi:hypothetical protein